VDIDPGRRRLHPRITDSDWLVLRKMRPAIEAMAVRVAEAQKVVIDLGCGAQPYRTTFEAHGFDYRGADLGGADLPIDKSGRVDASDASADVILSVQVLEHVANVDIYLSEALRLLRPGGWMILSTHGTWLYHPHPEDHRRWTRTGLISELGRHGFETTVCIPILGPLAWTTLVRLTCIYQSCLRLPLLGGALARAIALVMNMRGLLEDALTPAWVREDNACVYVTLSKVSGSKS